MGPAEGIAVALELFELGVDLYETRLRRENPGITDEEIEARLTAWLQTRPGAERGDGEGRVVEWPRRR